MNALAFIVVDENDEPISAYDLLVRHCDFYGNPEPNPARYTFALKQDGAPIILSDGGVFVMAVHLNAFPQYRAIPTPT